MHFMRNYFKYVAYLVVFIGFSFSRAGTYEEIFQAVEDFRRGALA